MNRKLLLSLQAKHNKRLEELRSQVQGGELRSEELAGVETEIESINTELQEVANELAELDAAEERDGKKEETKEDKKDDKEEKKDEVSEEKRSAALAAIAGGLSTKGHVSTQKKNVEIRSAFANYVVGKITEYEARALGIETGNGSVTVPEVIASEIITYAQEENLLRKYGSVHKTKGDVKYPVLVKKAEANVRKKERGKNDEIPETGIQFDEILLSPAEFDALATVTKKLLKMTGAPIEQIVIEELKKAYVRKETNYMFNGNDAGNENPGALSKKAVKYYESEKVDIAVNGFSQKLYQQIVKMKGQVVTEVLKKSMWIVNRSALTLLEGMTDTTGRPLLHVDATDGVTYKLIGHKLDFTDAASGTDPAVPVFYFGDFSAFHIQDVVGAMELQKLIEKFAGVNMVGFQIYNLLDGQLIYSPFEPAVYKYEVGVAKPVTP